MVGWFGPLLVAPFVGSFLGVLIRRLPAGWSIALARSRCESCARTLSPLDLVPLASYAALRGRCRTCGAPIGRFHLAIEAAAIGVAVWATSRDGGDPRVWADCVLGWTLLTLGWIDWHHRRLPDVLTLPLLLAGLLAAVLLAPEQLTDRAVAAAAGYAGFRTLELAYRLLRGRDGLGQGDAKLLASAGAWVGSAPLPSVVVGAAVIGLLAAATMRMRGAPVGATTALPFGPGLALATWLVWLYALPADGSV